MATKKAAVKKVVAKKATAPKAEKKAVKKPVGDFNPFVVFECTAIIPTQQYGNIQPKVQVTCGSIEEGRAMVMPVIEELYKTYAETPLNGRDPKFYGAITVQERVIETSGPAQSPAPAPKVETPATESSPEASAPSSSPSAAVAPTAAVEPTPEPVPAAQTPEPVMKATKAISLAASKEALAMVRNQIENSVKIDPSFKPSLLELCDAKYKELDVF